MFMHVREQIKTTPLIVPNIYDNPMLRIIEKNAVATVETLPMAPAASITSINICSSLVPFNCLGIALNRGVVDN
jgi:hypothetical protein